MTADDAAIRAVAARALELVRPATVVGLGSGRAAAAFVVALGERVREGFHVRGVATSVATAALAHAQGIAIDDLEEHTELDVTVDGADEVAPNLDLVKGWGNALVRERIVAAASRRQIILVGREKLVAALGERGRIPVEVVPFARAFARGRIADLGLVPTLRTAADRMTPLLSDNANVTLDCAPPRPLDPAGARALEAALRAIPGVVDTGLFLGTAAQVLVGDRDGRVEVLERRP